MTSRTRFVTALLAGLALLFSQLAVAAYACPTQAPAAVEDAADCGASVVNPNLCQSHCDYGSLSFEAAKPIQAPAAFVSCLRVAPADVFVALVRAPSPRAAQGPAPPPPLVRFTVLRI